MGIAAGQSASSRRMDNGRSLARPYAVTTILAALLLGLVGVAPAVARATTLSAGTLVVDRTDDDPAASACTDEVLDCSLRGALVNAAADADAEIETIEVPAGTFELTPGDTIVTGSLNVTSSVVINGAGPGQTIVDAKGVDRVLVVNGRGLGSLGALELSGVTLTGGRPCNQLGGGDDGNNAHGGGLMLAGAAVLTDVVITDNETCGFGGGIWVSVHSGSLVATRTVVAGNTSLQAGGGIASDGPITLIDSTVQGNQATDSHGGGIAASGGASVSGSTISGNVARGLSGGIYAKGSPISISNSTVSGNRATYLNTGTPQYFPGSGGGIAVIGTTADLRHVTVTNNLADWNWFHQFNGVGAGIYLSSGILTLDNSIVAGNTGEADCYLFGTSSVSGVGSFGCSTVAIEDPVLGPLADNGGTTLTHAVLEGSPALDTADLAMCLPTDQRGAVRPSGSGCDAGAYELQPFNEPTPTPPPPPSVDLVVADCSAPTLTDVVTVTGDITVTDPNCGELSLPNLTSVGGSIIVVGNGTLERLSLPLLGRVDGDITIADNGALTDVDLSSLSVVGGNLVVSTSPSITQLSVPVATVSGDVDISQNAALTVIELPALETVGGDFDASGNTTFTLLSASTLTTIGGDVDISQNAALTVIELPALETVGGDVDISQNATIAGGLPLVLRLPALLSVGGSLQITGNVELVAIETSALIDVGGDLTFTDNASLPSISVPALETVDGSLTLEAGQPTIDISDASVAGDSSITGVGTEMLIAETSLGTTTVSLRNGEASLEAVLPDGALSTNVPFTIERLAGSELEPQAGIDPLAAYQFDFDDATLDVNAALALSLDIEQLASSEAQAILDAFAAGSVTLAVRADGDATTYEPFAICAAGQSPAEDGCVEVQLEGSILSLRASAGHFSTWAVVMVAPRDTTPPVVTVPPDATLEAAGPDGAPFAFAEGLSAFDEIDGVVEATCDPASSSTFALGLTTLTCTASDTAGNVGTATFTVTVVDTTAPLVEVPADITIGATTPTGAVVTYSTSASDLVDGAIAPTCDPASGVTFAVGDTTVSCEAMDNAGNPGSATFVIHVLNAVDQLTALRDDVAAASPPLTSRLADDLRTKLTDALAKLALGKTDDGCKKIQDFAGKVTQEAGKQSISTTIAADWLRRAQQIRAVLGC